MKRGGVGQRKQTCASYLGLRWLRVLKHCGGLQFVGGGLLCAMFVCMFCACTIHTQVDEASPTVVDVSISAGSNLDEASQYAEVRLVFSSALEAKGDAASDVNVLLNGEAPDARTIQTSVTVDSDTLLIRLTPTEEAAQGGAGTSIYYALYDGLIQVSAAREDGVLAHLFAAGTSSNATLTSTQTFTVPTGISLEKVDVSGADSDEAGGVADADVASVTFEINDFAHLRCCAWFWFSPDLPLVMMHNHEFLRDTPRTCAERLCETINENYSDKLSASCDGARVTVCAKDTSIETLDARLVEGVGVSPQDDAIFLAQIWAGGTS